MKAFVWDNGGNKNSLPTYNPYSRQFKPVLTLFILVHAGTNEKHEGANKKTVFFYRCQVVLKNMAYKIPAYPLSIVF